jgi:peroxiredoxin
MAETLSTMIPLETAAAFFSLPDVTTNKIVSLTDYPKPIAMVIMFICNHCPYVKHIQNKLVEVATIYQQKGIPFIAINSNDVQAYPADGPDEMKKIAQQNKYPFPYLFDESQAVAKAYHAACTPDFYIFNSELKCVYRGRFDGSTPSNAVPVTGRDLCQALDALLAKKEINSEQKQSIGCNIKWKR